MKILLAVPRRDECVTRKTKRLLTEYEVFTVTEMGFNGLKNGELLASAVEANFNILLTIDKNIDSQQNVSKFSVAIVVLDVFRSNIKYIEPLIPEFKQRIGTFQSGNSYQITTQK